MRPAKSVLKSEGDREFAVQIRLIPGGEAIGPISSQSTPVIGGGCQVGTPNYQIGGKQTQFFLKCEPASDDPNKGTWVVKSRSLIAQPSQQQQQQQQPTLAPAPQPLPTAAPPAPPPTVEHKTFSIRLQQPTNDAIQCGQDMNARDGVPCNCPENCLQLDYNSAQCYLQCDAITRHWVRRSCQNGYVFSFEHQACIGTTISNFLQVPAPQPSQTLTPSLTQQAPQPQVQQQVQIQPQQTSQPINSGPSSSVSVDVNNAAGVVCTFHDCSHSKPCSTGTCNNGYCCSLTAVSPLNNNVDDTSNSTRFKRFEIDTLTNTTTLKTLEHSLQNSTSEGLKDPDSILWSNDFPVGPPGFGFPPHISTLDQILVKASGNGLMCAAGFISPIKCDNGGECPVGLFCDSAIESCCPLLLPLTDPTNPKPMAASIRIEPPKRSTIRRHPTSDAIFEAVMNSTSEFSTTETAIVVDSSQNSNILSNALRIPIYGSSFSSCGSSCGNNNYQVIRVPSYNSCGTSCPRGYSGCCGTQAVSCCLRQICPGNLMPTGRSCYSSCPIGQICISGVCCPSINCPGGYQPNGVCNNGYCSAGFQCVRNLNMCCPVIMQNYNSCPGGSNSMGSCVNGRCGNGYACNSNSNQCCMDPMVCPDGTQAAGACVNNMCGQGYSCIKGLCCAASSQTLKCLDGSQAVGACINGKCGMGYVCTTGNICCPANMNVCPAGLSPVGPCINRMCPSGYTCYGTGSNAQCCGQEQQANNNNGVQFGPEDAIGPCMPGNTCEPGYECDTTDSPPQCYPTLGAYIGPCLDGVTTRCPDGGYCVQSEHSCYEHLGVEAVQAPPEYDYRT